MQITMTGECAAEAASNSLKAAIKYIECRSSLSIFSVYFPICILFTTVWGARVMINGNNHGLIMVT